MSRDRGADLHERFRRWLRDRHQPITRQRDDIAMIVLNSDSRLSVEEIGAALRDRGTPVSAATIYRSLEVLVRSGLVREHDFGEGFRRYEARRSDDQAGYLICSRCNGVTPFELHRLERVLPMIADQHDFAAMKYRVEIHGHCGSCREREIVALRRAGAAR